MNVFNILLITSCIILVCCQLFNAPISWLPFRNNTQTPQIIYVPVPVQAEYYQAIQQQNANKEQKEANVFPHIISIVGDVGKILIDRHNKENVVNGFAHMIGNIVNFVKDVTTKGPLSDERIALLANQLAEQWMSLA